MCSRRPARATEHAQVRPGNWPAADEVLDDSLDQTLLRMMLSGQTGRIARAAAADHCVYAAQLTELALSGRLLDRDGRPVRARGAPARSRYPAECLPRHLTWESWDELFWSEPRLMTTARMLATQQLIDRGLWRRAPWTWPACWLGARFQQLYPGEGERLTAWVDDGTWRYRQESQPGNFRRATLRSLLRLYRGDPEGAVLALRNELEAGVSAALAEHRAAAAVILGASGALAFRSIRWLVPEFSGGAPDGDVGACLAIGQDGERGNKAH
jgi:hypothetical protein